MDDIEKATYPEAEDVDLKQPASPVVETSSSRSRTGFYGKFLNGLDKVNAASARLEAMVGMETRGIERVPENLRTDNKPSGGLFVWLAANCVLSTFGIGYLGPQLFSLGLGDSMLVIFFTNTLTAILPAYMATFGPALGLRQMTSARYSWGWHGAKVVALLNCIACVGWSSVNTIAGAQTLRVVANEHISHAVGVVVIAIITLFVGLMGYKWVHMYEKYSWIPTAITFIVLLGCSAKGLANTPMAVGTAASSGCLSFIATCFGFAAGWISLASDYNIYRPADTPTWNTFAWTYTGLIFPLILVEWLGAAIMCGAVSDPTGPWMAGFEEGELGGLLGAVLKPVLGNGGGGFFLFWLVLSVVANNIINVYSLGLSISVIGEWIARVPRIVWPVICTGIYIPVAIVGATHFASSIDNFMLILGYWLALYVTVVLEEHFIFRGGNFKNYRAAETWNDRKQLPVGFAALAAFAAGAVGAAMGMSQAWYAGPLALKAGGMFGSDIGFELAAGFAGVVYAPARYLELKYVGR